MAEEITKMLEENLEEKTRDLEGAFKRFRAIDNKPRQSRYFSSEKEFEEYSVLLEKSVQASNQYSLALGEFQKAILFVERAGLPIDVTLYKNRLTAQGINLK